MEFCHEGGLENGVVAGRYVWLVEEISACLYADRKYPVRKDIFIMQRGEVMLGQLL